MELAKKITMYVTILSVIGLLVYDGVIVFMYGQSASVSAMIIKWSYQQPSMVFFCGFVCGHLFWRMRDSKLTKAITKAVKDIDKQG
jgi:hypothetical protein